MPPRRERSWARAPGATPSRARPRSSGSTASTARKGRPTRRPRRPSRPSRRWTATRRGSKRWCFLSGTEPISCPAGAAKGTEGVPGLPQEAKPRLDALLVERGLAESRARAQALVLSGAVRVGGEVVTKAGLRIGPDADLYVETNRESPFVSRAGEKLSHALDAFGVEVGNRDCLDAGASTGGFTDVLLR